MPYLLPGIACKKYLFFRLATLFLVTACGYVDYENAPAGKFEGSLFVMWIDDGGPLGDGTFVYVPNPGDPLTFNRSAGGSVRPQMMYTDGGSIPRLAHVFQGLNPWGYAPAYMIHDWLFVAKNCNTDGVATPQEAKMRDIKFQESADIIAEAIKGLIEANRVREGDVAPRVISSAVAGPVSRHLWFRKGACPQPRVSEEDRHAAEAAIPGSSRPVGRAVRTLDDGTTIPLAPAQLVDVIQF